jgi:hypothetical protein
MNRSTRVISVYQECLSALVLLSMVVGGLVAPLTPVLAAQVTVDAAVSTATTEHSILGSATVWVSDQVGYKFYVDGTGICVYSKSINGGTNWSIAVEVDNDIASTAITCFGITVWYDKWTPGDGGSYIHILTHEADLDRVRYNRLDTLTDELLSNSVSVDAGIASGQTGTISAGSNLGSITKATNGIIYIAMNDNTDSYVIECSSNCGVTTSWTETGANPMDPQPDYSLLMPLPDGDILLINRDISADDLRSKVWDDSAGSWSGAWTTINANAPENTTYDPGMAAMVDTNTGDIYLVYIDWATTGTLGGNDDDVRTATYSGGVWTNKTDVITNTTRGLTGVAIGIDANTSDVYIAYTARTTVATATTGNVYWKSSTDGMTSWSAETGPINAAADDIYGVDINNTNYQRLTIAWYGATPDDMFIENALADLVPVFEVTKTDLQKTEVRASTTDFYVGGSFAFTETSATRDVTDITISEMGSINAATALNNIELWYDVDTSAPYDCESESYDGGETQFGATDTDGFSSANGTSTFTDTISVSPTQAMCVYVVLDVLKAANGGSTIDIEISNPDTDVLVSGGATAVPNYPVVLSGDTTVKLESDFRVQRGVIEMNADTQVITAGVHYDAPVSADRAFIRITNTGHTGAGPSTGSGTRNADDVTVRMINPENIMNSITFQRGTTAAGTTRIAWEIVEYKGVSGGDNEFVVRRQEDLSYISANTTLTSSAVSGIVNDADVAVFITSQYNANTGATVYHYGLSTAAWNSGGDTVTFTRGAGGSVSIVSYAVVEFTGANWKVQRAQHVYTAAGATETESITAVNSLSRTFIHTQKRAPSSTHANFGHQVWLSGIGQVSFLLDSAATTPGSHVSVAWIIENTQTNGTPMVVTRSNAGLNTTGSSPQTNLVSIGKTLDDLSIASIFTNNNASTTNNTWPEPILSVRLISTTQYEVWRSDITAGVSFRTEVVEWPTAERKLEQGYYRLYVDNNALTPSDPWPAGAPNLGENTEMTADDGALALGDQVRIRMTVEVNGASMPADSTSFTLQFAPRVTTCTAVSNWFEVGDPASTTAHWRGVNGTPADGAALSSDPPTGGDLLLSVSNIAGTYEEANDSATNPYLAFPGEQIEYDWLVEHNGANDKTSYCFRMIESGGAVFSAYNYYPVLRTVGYEPLITNWRWYDDEASLTPSTPRAAENVSPSNIENQNAFKLRLVLKESSGADGVNVKFAMQVSEYADFSQGVSTLTSSTSCIENSLWCYHDGAGNDNDSIQSAIITGADACVAGVGDGCGTRNEGSNPAGVTFDQVALSSTEFEFTIKQAGARSNRVYYFRLYDLTNDEPVGVADTFSYPSLVTEGALLSFSVAGINTGTLTAGVTTDFTTSPTIVDFDPIPFNTELEAAQRISVSTNATEGYQILKVADQQLLNAYGDAIPPVTGSNAAPTGWATGCLSSASGCFGYHSTDATLSGGSARFGPTDSYAALATTPAEIMYSSVPMTDQHDVIYKLRVTGLQPAGEYTTALSFIAVPVH